MVMNELKDSLLQIKNPPILRSSWKSKPIVIASLPEYPYSKKHINYKLQRLFECPSTVLSNDKGFEVVPSVHINCCMKFERRRKIN
jgi:hypothetical protein